MKAIRLLEYGGQLVINAVSRSRKEISRCIARSSGCNYR